jgi:hypothetical protein
MADGGPWEIMAAPCKRCEGLTTSIPCPACDGPACADCGRCPQCDGPVPGKEEDDG